MYRKTYARIDLENLQKNIKNAKEHLPDGCMLAAVVKADAYGHGALRCAQASQSAGAGMLAVALAEEAIVLREAGMTLPIMIIGRSNTQQLKLAVKLGLEPCVFTPQQLALLQQEAEKAEKTIQVHLKIDTGMSRIGLRSIEELDSFLDVLGSCGRIALNGVFTHFANGDAQDKGHANKQHEMFMRYVEHLHARGLHPMVHADNSAGTIDLPQFGHDMVRFGISMYGYYASAHVCRKQVALFPVMEVFAEISHIKTIPAGTCVGYGSTFTAERETKVATVQIGYGDGYNRLLSNRGRMIVTTDKGAFYAPIIGRVCMDQTMIDLTDVQGTLAVGDEAVVLGCAGDKKIDADEIAGICGTISYEVLLDFNARVPRIYND
ncbi:MAG: alanine racemase [Christensenella sp.]|uniref:alanine racemase n=1 Tax=Christensenella sp. TaxID=1935934 RepID=UPI002B1EAE19|nr:alanine racemase [Christensenella sp.]MEA5003717.1 alanine racemase [Christensenella sp.]